MRNTPWMGVVVGVALSVSALGRPVLYENGPIVSHPGAGFGGADLSEVNTALGYNVYGFGCQLVNLNRVADDFTVPAGQVWKLSKITLYGYQTGATTPTINHVNYRIWNGSPNTGSVVFGDTTTNRLSAANFINVYRAYDTDPLSSQRHLLTLEVACSINLAQGTYFVDWQYGGTLSIGPWADPVVVPLPSPMAGASAPGNALQQLAGTGMFNPCLDNGVAGTQVAFPFKIEGTIAGTCYPDCDQNGSLNITDFVCFQTRFALGAPYGDCDGNGLLDLNDFICFQTKFAVGCQ